MYLTPPLVLIVYTQLNAPFNVLAKGLVSVSA